MQIHSKVEFTRAVTAWISAEKGTRQRWRANAVWAIHSSARQAVINDSADLSVYWVHPWPIDRKWRSSDANNWSPPSLCERKERIQQCPLFTAGILESAIIFSSGCSSKHPTVYAAGHCCMYMRMAETQINSYLYTPQAQGIFGHALVYIWLYLLGISCH